MKRFVFLVYGIVCYAIFFVTFLYLIGFVGNFYTPTSLVGTEALPIVEALLVNIGLLLLFAVQHSLMARTWFKKWWTQYIPEPIERSTYLLFTSIALILIFMFWQPIGGYFWNIENETATLVLLILFGLGWGLVLLSTFLINHFDLFGLRQVWLYFKQQPYSHLPFKTPLLYKWVRHPLYLGFLIALWAAPQMSYARLFFAIVLTFYILIAIEWEEHDLLNYFGEKYRQYSEHVPKIFPRIIGRKKHVPEFEKIIEHHTTD